MLLTLVLRSWPFVLYLCFGHLVLLASFSLTAVQNIADSSLQSSKLPTMPPPLQIPPSRARRQFAARLAQRKALLEATREQEDDVEDIEEEIRKEERANHERFSNIFEEIDDDSSEDDAGIEEGDVVSKGAQGTETGTGTGSEGDGEDE